MPQTIVFDDKFIILLMASCSYLTNITSCLKTVRKQTQTESFLKLLKYLTYIFED